MAAEHRKSNGKELWFALGSVELLLTNRELAVALWATVGFMFALTTPKFRASARQVLEQATSKHMVVGAVSVITWNVAAVVLFRDIGLWTFSMLPTTIVSIGHCFGSVGQGAATDTTLNLEFYWSTVSRHVGATAILAFMLELTTFGLLAELVLVFSIIALSMLLAFADSNPQYGHVVRMCRALLAGIGLLMLARGTWGFYVGWGTWSIEALLNEVLMPAVIAVAFLPALVVMTAYTAYERVFSSLSVHAAGRGNPDLKRAKRKLLITRFGLNLERLQQFRRSQSCWAFVASRDYSSAEDLLDQYLLASSPNREMQ